MGLVFALPAETAEGFGHWKTSVKTAYSGWRRSDEQWLVLWAQPEINPNRRNRHDGGSSAGLGRQSETAAGRIGSARGMVGGPLQAWLVRIRDSGCSGFGALRVASRGGHSKASASCCGGPRGLGLVFALPAMANASLFSAPGCVSEGSWGISGQGQGQGQPRS